MLHIHITKSGIFTGNSLGFLAISDAMRWFSAAAKAPYWKWGPSLPSPLSYFLYKNSILPSRDTLVITWVVDIISGKCCAIALTWNNKLACHDWEFVHIYRWTVLAAVDFSRLTEPIININEVNQHRRNGSREKATPILTGMQANSLSHLPQRCKAVGSLSSII